MDRQRYSRNISVEGFGEEGQRRLLESSVLVLGCGALGSVVAAYLAGAGIGHLTLVDFDTIDITNLQRQILYTEPEAGAYKATTLADRLTRLNSSIKIDAIREFVTPAKARELFKGHDFIVDASDNPDTKYMIDDACHELGLPYTIAGVLGMNGQIMTHVPGSARYCDFFPESAGAGYTPCSIGGILGPLPGIIGSIQALEAIKYLSHTGTLLTDRILIVDGRDLHFNEVRLR